MTMKRAFPRALVACTALAVLAGCGFTDETKTATDNSGSVVPNYLPIAKESTTKAMKGTNRPVEAKSRPAVKGKKLGIVMTAEFVVSVGYPARAAKAAAEAIGWQVSMFDANNDPTLFATRVQDAVTSGVDGIILVSIDCQKVKNPLQAAKAKGIKVTSIYGYDCNDPLAGGEAQGMFDGFTNYGPAAANIDDFTKSYGADQANYIISESENKAKIIGINNPEYTVLNWTWAGFKEAIEKSGGSEIVEEVEVSTADVGNAQTGMNPKIVAALQRHPEATWIKSPFTYVTTLGIDAVLNTTPRDIKVMGGEGYKEELDLMRGGKKTVTAMNVIASEWTGWASIDTLNSVFRNEKPADSGLGWQIVDSTNVPKTEQFEPPVDFKGIYRKAWGIG
jgi:ribose transport system substrate-binding protein